MLGAAVSKAWGWQVPIAVCMTWPWDVISGTWGWALQWFCASWLSQEGFEEELAQRLLCAQAPCRPPSSTAVGKEARPFETRQAPHGYSSPFGKTQNTTTPSPVSFCATANIATVLAGRGSYFVYVWTSILIDRVSCNPILNYRFFKADWCNKLLANSSLQFDAN